MTEEIKDKLKKVYALVNNGATEGERDAAKKAIDRILKSYNLDDSILNELDFKDYFFKYATNNEGALLKYIVDTFVPERVASMRSRPWERSIRIPLQYIDYVTIEASYEYFRRHMKKEWTKNVKPQLDRCRKVKTRNKMRYELNHIFVMNYIIASGLVDKSKIVSVNMDELSISEQAKRLSLMGVQGGSYNKQVVGGLMLNETN